MDIDPEIREQVRNNYLESLGCTLNLIDYHTYSKESRYGKTAAEILTAKLATADSQTEEMSICCDRCGTNFLVQADGTVLLESSRECQWMPPGAMYGELGCKAGMIDMHSVTLQEKVPPTLNKH